MQEQFNSDLKLYGLQDKLTGITTMFMTAYSDKAALDSYLSYLNDIFKGLKTEKEKTNFMKAVHKSQAVRVGIINVLQPSVENDFQTLADFNDVVLDIENKEKNENGKCE